MTIEEKLDLILSEAKDQFSHLPIKENWERICRLVTNGDGKTTGNPDYQHDPYFNMLLKGLVEENYIQKYTNTGERPNLEYYVATVKGLTFEGFKNAKKIKDGAKRKDILEKIMIGLVSVLAGALLSYFLRPVSSAPIKETIVLPKIQVVHDTIFVTEAANTEPKTN